ncbi:MAG TPA: SCO family protein, partial [Flavobacteriaceae bacterium]|nr:SCO family protein [Flavobacteriaceae bacterium]
MKSFLGAYKKFFIALAIVSAVVVSLFYQALKPKKTLPIYQPNQVDASLVADSLQHVKKYHKIADFSLINQWGDTITQADFEGKIYVADFFFTTCLTICPVMSDHMSELQREYAQDEQVLFLSHTVTP